MRSGELARIAPPMRASAAGQSMRNPTTGDDLVIFLDEMDWFEVVG